ncbi:hypothetical protein DFS34DRAFT_679051 [Phlyctochytrium arcticum]|nr:hypothetical protein DFS34DRAFT_679051 [Phlyctochytrium arcticum]
MPRRLDGLYQVCDDDIRRMQQVEDQIERNLSAQKQINAQLDEHFTKANGDPSSVICKTCIVKIKDNIPAKKKNLRSRGHAMQCDAEPAIPEPNLPAAIHTINNEGSSHITNAMELDHDTLLTHNFHTTTPPRCTSSLYDYLRQQAERARLQAEAAYLEEERMGEEYVTETTVDPPVGDETRRPRSNRNDPEWAPFPDRTSALCAILMTMSRHPLSNATLKMIWWWAGQLGLTLPSIQSVQGLLAKLHTMTGGQVKEHESPLKTPFHMIDVASIVAQEVANPEVMRHLKTFSETSDVLSEMYHAEKWHSDPALQAPMVRIHSMDIFLKDFVWTVDNVCLQVERFTVKDGELFACGTQLKDTPDGLYLSTNITVNIKTFQQIIDMPPPPQISIIGRCSPTNIYTTFTAEELKEVLAPHPLKARAGGHRVIMVPIILFCDDSAGTSSKKWNPFYNWYIQLGGLPFELSQRDFHTHFLATSNKASALEMADALVNCMNNKLVQGVWSWDSAALEPVLVTGAVVCMLDDNPMHSELCSTMDFGKANRFCRACKVKGKFETAEELGQFLAPGEPRNWAETQAEVFDQLDLACSFGNKTRLKKQQTMTGVKCQLSARTMEKLTKYAKNHSVDATRAFRETLGPAKALVNPLFRLTSFDGHRDCPLEALHTVLLGVIKWLSRASLALLSKDQKQELCLRVDALNWQGFTRPFRGKEIYDGILPQSWIKAWCCMADVFLLVYLRRIPNLEAYVVDLQRAITALFAAVCDIDHKIFSRRKYHALVHLTEDVRRFGPAVLFATEKFESFNPIVRVHGGYWQEGSRYVNGGPKLVDLFKDETVQSALGLSASKEERLPIAPYTLKIGTPVSFEDTLTCKLSMYIPPSQAQVYQRWTSATVRRIETRIRVGDFMGTEHGLFGRVLEILQETAPATGKTKFLVEFFEHDGEFHNECPIITPFGLYEVLEDKDIQGTLNVQHLCSSECGIKTVHQQMIERQTRNISHDAWVHSDEQIYLINVFCVQLPWVRSQFPRQYPTIETTNLAQHCQDAFTRQRERECHQLEQLMMQVMTHSVQPPPKPLPPAAVSSSVPHHSLLPEDLHEHPYQDMGVDEGEDDQEAELVHERGRDDGLRGKNYIIDQ